MDNPYFYHRKNIFIGDVSSKSGNIWLSNGKIRQTKVLDIWTEPTSRDFGTSAPFPLQILRAWRGRSAKRSSMTGNCIQGFLCVSLWIPEGILGHCWILAHVHLSIFKIFQNHGCNLCDWIIWTLHCRLALKNPTVIQDWVGETFSAIQCVAIVFACHPYIS